MNAHQFSRGFTLVEALVTGVLATILGFVVYTVAFVYTNESSTSISRFMMQQQFDNVAAQIASDTRLASYVVAEGETPFAHGIGSDSVASVQFFNVSGQTFAHYSIVNGTLYEGIPQRPYSAGGGAVNLIGESSFFIVAPQRKAVTLHFLLCKNEGSRRYILSTRKAVFSCRN